MPAASTLCQTSRVARSYSPGIQRGNKAGIASLCEFYSDPKDSGEKGAQEDWQHDFSAEEEAGDVMSTLELEPSLKSAPVVELP